MSAAAFLLERLAAAVPRWSRRKVRRRGEGLGRLAYRFDARHRRVALENLQRAFPESDAAWRAEVARASFAQAGRTVFEMLWTPRLVDMPVHEFVCGDGVERLVEASRAGTGALLVGSHFGNWEVAGVMLPRLGVPLVSIARPLDDPRLDALLLRLRTATGAAIVAKRDAVRGALRALREGKVVTVLCDQNTLRKEAVFVPYFGELAATTPLAAHLHLRSGAPIFPGFSVPEQDGYRIVVEPPIETRETERDRAVLDITAAITRRIEHWARQRPEAWLWMHDRWRERP